MLFFFFFIQSWKFWERGQEVECWNPGSGIPSVLADSSLESGQNLLQVLV